MKKVILVIFFVLCVGVVQLYAKKMGTEICFVEALAFSNTGKHLVYLTAEIPSQKCDESEAAVLDPKIFAGTSVLTNLQLALIFGQEVQIGVEGCIDAKDVEGPVETIDEVKTFPRIVDIVFYGKNIFRP